MVCEVEPPSWLWKATARGLAITLGSGLALVAAISLGWRAARPTAPPDWQLDDTVALAVTPPADRAVHWLERPLGAFTFEAEGSLLPGPAFSGYGLAFRAQEREHYRVFAVGPDGYLAVLEIDGQIETALLDWQQFTHVRRDTAPNRLRISCAGGTCSFWVNDEYVAQLPDDPSLAGDVGFWGRRFAGEDVRVAFSHVQVWEQIP